MNFFVQQQRERHEGPRTAPPAPCRQHRPPASTFIGAAACVAHAIGSCLIDCWTGLASLKEGAARRLLFLAWSGAVQATGQVIIGSTLPRAVAMPLVPPAGAPRKHRCRLAAGHSSAPGGRRSCQSECTVADPALAALPGGGHAAAAAHPPPPIRPRLVQRSGGPFGTMPPGGHPAGVGVEAKELQEVTLYRKIEKCAHVAPRCTCVLQHLWPRPGRLLPCASRQQLPHLTVESWCRILQVVAAPGRCAIPGAVCAVGGAGPGAGVEGGQPALVPGAAGHHGPRGDPRKWRAQPVSLLAAGCFVLS